MTLKIQAFLRENSLDALKPYAIKMRRHRLHDNLVCLKYDQINSPFAEPLVRQCRGIVLDELDGWRVVCWAFGKFFNHGEGHAAPIDWSTARVQEKVDGSLCTLYPYAGKWHVATTGTPDASGEVNGFGMTFADYFWETFRTSGLNLPPVTCPCNFSFELTGPLNRIVVQHKEPGLTLLSARDIRTLQEFTATEAERKWVHGARVVREWPLQSFEEIAATFADMSPLSQEGYVVVDGDYNRVKVKHPGYVALHHAKDGISPKAFVEIARNGETSEVLSAFPEFAPMMEEARTRLGALRAELEADYARLRDIPDQKAFALQAVKSRLSAALFSVRAGKVASIADYLRTYRLDALMGLLGYRDNEAAPITEAA